MKCSPQNSRHVGALVPLVTSAMRRRVPNVRFEVLLDAVSAAVERSMQSAFLQSDRSPAEVYCWLRTATMRELLREFRLAGRYVGHEHPATAFDDEPGYHTADHGAMRSVLWGWLVQHLGHSVAETMWLHSIEGCPPRDIAAMQRTSVASVKARITRARKTMRRHRAALV